MADMNGLLTNPLFNMGMGLLGSGGYASGGMKGLLQAQNAAYQQQLIQAMQDKREQAKQQEDARQRMAGLMSATPIPGSGPLNANPQPAYQPDLAAQQMIGDLAKGSPQVFDQMAQQQFAPPAPKLTDDQREYQFARQQGYQGSFQDWLLDQRRAGAAQTTIQNTLSEPFDKELGKRMGESLVAQHDKMYDLLGSFQNIGQMKQMLDAGMKTGVLADFKVGFGKMLQEAGINYDQDEIANTEAFTAAAAKETANIIKDFGAGTGLSDADREYAEKAAGGKIKMTEASLRKILNIREFVIRKNIERYNEKVQQLKTSPYGKTLPYELAIPLPEAPATPSTSGPSLEERMKKYGF